MSPQPVIPSRGLHLPAGRPRINRAHPAAASLLGGWVFDAQTPYDLVGTIGTATPFVGTPALRSSLVGACTEFAGAGQRCQATVSGEVSLVAMAMRTVTPSSGVNAIGLIASTMNLAVAQTGFELELGNAFGDANRIYSTKWTAGAVAAADGLWVDGAKQTTSPSDITVANQQWYGIATRFTGLPAGSDSLLFGAIGNSQFIAPGVQVALFLVFAALPDDLMADLSVNPTGVLLFPQDEEMPTSLWARVLRAFRPFIFRH